MTNTSCKACTGQLDFDSEICPYCKTLNIDRSRVLQDIQMKETIIFDRQDTIEYTPDLRPPFYSFVYAEDYKTVKRGIRHKRIFALHYNPKKLTRFAVTL